MRRNGKVLISGRERRNNNNARDAIDIAVVYIALFGVDVAREHLRTARVAPQIAERVLAGRARARLFPP